MEDQVINEQNRRRRDTGSGLSIELLPKKILDFIFHPMVRGKLLGNFSGISDKFSDDKKNIYYGSIAAASKGESKEIVFLGASSSDISDIVSIMDSTNIMGVLNSVEEAIGDDSVTAEEFRKYPIAEIQNTAVNLAVSAIGPKIKICTSTKYSFGDENGGYAAFVKNHTSQNGRAPVERLFSYFTKGTNQGKILVDSYSTGVGSTSMSVSHPELIDSKTLWEGAKQYTGPMKDAKRRIAMWKNGNG